MPFGTWVPSDEADKPQRNALERLLSAMPEPGLVQQAGMLKDHLASLGPVLPAARGANDLLDLFGKMGPIGADLNQQATGALNAAGSRLEAGAAALRKPNDFLPGLSTEPADLLNPTHLAQGAAHAALTGLGKSPLGVTDAELIEQGRGDLDALSPDGQRLLSGSRTGDEAARFVGQGMQLGNAWAGTGLRDVAEDAAGAVARSGIRRGQRGRRVTPLTPEEQAARAADMQAEEGIFGAIQDLWKRGLADEADDLRLAAMGKGRQGLVAARDYLREQGLPVDALQRFLTEESGALRVPEGLRMPKGLRMPNLGEVSEAMTSVPLSSPASLWSNVVSGGSRTFQRWAQESAGAATQGSFRESLDDLMGMVRAVPGALREAPEHIARGPTPETGANLAAGGLSTSTSPQARLTTAGVRVNAATDELFRTLNAAGARARAGGRGFDPAVDPLDASLIAGKETGAADFATWAGNNTWVAQTLQQARAWASDPAAPLQKRLSGVALSFIAPYVRMPERVLRSTLQLTSDPINMAVQAGLGKGPLGRAARAGDVEAQRELAGRAIVGVLSWIGVVGSYAAGQLRGAPPRDPKERRRLEAEGIEWNTWSGLKLRDLGNFGQSAGIIATALQGAEQAMAKGKTPDDILRAGFNSAAKYIWDESYLRGFSDLGTAINEEGAEQAVEKLAIRGAGRFGALPAALVGAADPVEREVRGAEGELRNQTPGGRFTLPARIDPATGQPVQREGNYLTRLLGERGTVESPEGRELARLGVTAREFKPQDTPYGLAQTPEARRLLQETYGRYTRDYLRDTMARPDYQRADDATKAATLERQIGLAKKFADLEVGDRVARDPEARYELEWLRTPHYQGVRGAPDEVARRNLEISEAKALLAEYRARYGTGQGTSRLAQEDTRTFNLAMTPELPPPLLAQEQRKVRARTGAPAPTPAALPGAGNRVLPTPAPAFTAP